MSHFGMFTDAGDAAVRAIVEMALTLPITTSNCELYAFLSHKMDAIKADHPEVWDTEVRACLIGAIERRTRRELTIYF